MNKYLIILIGCLFILVIVGILIWQFWSGGETPLLTPTVATDEAADIEFLKKSPLFDWDTFEFGLPKTVTAVVQSAPYYGPILDQELYQLEQNISGDESCKNNPDDYEYCSNFLFAESRIVNLKEYLGEVVEVTYRPIKRAIMGEQPIVIVDSIIPADWQKYKNDKDGYEVKYPEDIIIDENPGDKTLGSVQFSFPRLPNSSDNCFVGFNGFPFGLDPDSNIDSWRDQITISGEEYDRNFWEDNDNGIFSLAFINMDYPQNPDYPYFLIYHSIEPECLSKIDLILSTFKFID